MRDGRIANIDRKRMRRGIGIDAAAAVPPLSCTWKVKLASGDPIAFAAGVNSSLPAEMSAALTYWPTVTAVPLSVSVPAVPVGSVAIFTASRLLGGLSLGSLKPKSDAANV